MSDLGLLNGGDNQSEGDGIGAGNNSIAGWSGVVTNGVPTAGIGFYYDGSLHSIGTLSGDTDSQAWAIAAVSGTDTVAGWSGKVGNDQPKQAITWTSGGGMKAKGRLPGGDISWAWAINDIGTVAGFSNQSTGATTHHAIRIPAGTAPLKDLGTLPGDDTAEAFGINHGGTVVGVSKLSTSTRNSHAFVYDDTNGMQDLNSLTTLPSGVTLLDARAINDSGLIVGKAMVGMVGHAFLLTPSSGPSLPFFPGKKAEATPVLPTDVASPAGPDVGLGLVPSDNTANVPAPTGALDDYWVSETNSGEQPWWEWGTAEML